MINDFGPITKILVAVALTTLAACDIGQRAAVTPELISHSMPKPMSNDNGEWVTSIHQE